MDTKKENHENQKEDRIILEELQHTNTNSDPNLPLHTMDTLSETMNALKNKGYTTDFNLKKDHLICEKCDKEIQVYPNPFNETVKVHWSESSNKKNYQVLSLEGKLILKGNIFSNQSIDLRFLPKGVYLLKIENQIKKLIKR